jgi:hypothetical protein
MIDLLEESERLLQSAGISTHLIEAIRGKALAFEGETVLGFVVAYEDCTQLIERWSTDTDALVTENQLSLRRAQSKAWNAYTIFLSAAEASYGDRVTGYRRSSSARLPTRLVSPKPNTSRRSASTNRIVAAAEGAGLAESSVKSA